MHLLSRSDSGYTRRGTLAFMAPEVYYGTEGGYYPTEAADIFSFSLMMYEVLTGVHLTKPLEQGMCCLCVRATRFNFFQFMYGSSIY